MHSFRTAGLLAIAFVVLIVATGCASNGPKFTPVSSIPPGKGVVYVYRQPKFAGSAVYGTVKANDVPITKVRSGGYYPYITDPGTVHFSVTTEATNTADVTVKASEEKYLKTTIGMGFFVGHLKLSEVSPEIGKREIGECELLEPIPAP